MQKFKAIVEYDGTGLAGWQAQRGQYTVQAAVENALVKATGARVEVTASGRTDAGVHALGQVISFEVDEKWSGFKIREAINFYLRRDELLPINGQVVVLDAEVAAAEFNARFDATRRHYVYKIINRRPHLALEACRAWNIQEKLDADLMQEAAQVLVGKHDFTSFRSSECQAKSPLKTIDKIQVTRSGELIEVKISARSFLHHQVRNIVGSLRLVGNVKWEGSDLKAALEAKNRAAAGATAPAHGLYLVSVDY